jgi:hypothetical protein
MAKLVRPGRGRVRVAPHGRYLMCEDGAPFFAVGHAEAFGFFFQPMNPLALLDGFLAAMATRGQNTLVVQVENQNMDFYGGHRLSLEHPVGHYDEGVARQFDDLLGLAEKHGIYVITYLWDTFNMDFNWDVSPYNVANGGPCRFVSEMLTSREAIALQKRKFEWALARWGDHPQILAWELMNEIEWAVAGKIPGNQDAEGEWHLATDDEMKAWVDEMAPFVRSFCMDRFGRCPLLTVSTNDPTYPAPWLYAHPGLDFATNHQYFWNENASTYPAHPMEAILATRDGVRSALDRTGWRRPYMDTETGPLGFFLENPGQVFPIDDAYQHGMMWTNWACGAAGSGLRWPYPNYGFGGYPHLNPLSEAMWGSLEAMAKISALVDWLAFAGRHADDALAVAGDACVAMACRDAQRLIGWIVQDDRVDAREVVEAEVRFSGLGAGPHEVLWCDDATGEVLRRDAAEGGAFTLVSPGFRRHVAVVVRPA